MPDDARRAATSRGGRASAGRRDRGAASVDTPVTSRKRHPRVERRVREVGQQVDEDDEDREDERHELDDGVVPRRDRRDQQRSEPGEPEDLLDDDRRRR